VTPLLHITGSGWQEIELHLDALFLAVGLLVAYWYAVTVWRPHIRDAGRVKRSQVAYYCTGVLAVWIGAGTPIHDISEEYLLSMHMTQHLLFTLVAPPLLLAGIPSWLWQALLGPDRVRPIANVVLHPLVAIFTFNMLLVITHLPHVLDFALEEHWFHFAVHAMLVATAFQMWWPIITRVPGLPQLSYPYQMAYLFVQSLLPAVVASFITFSETAVYSYYEQANLGHLPGGGPADRRRRDEDDGHPYLVVIHRRGVLQVVRAGRGRITRTALVRSGGRTGRDRPSRSAALAGSPLQEKG
jgi:cytochrome c oxidase assembly factor CtaG